MIAKAAKHRRWQAANQAEVAEFFGVSCDTVALWRRKGMPGTPGRYDLADVLKWLRSEGPWRSRAELVGGDDLLGVASGDSPNLERYRAARAQLAEMKVEERRRSLLPRDQVRSGLSRFASHLRQLAERLGKRHGPEATVSVNETIEECRRVIRDEFGDSGNGVAGVSTD